MEKVQESEIGDIRPMSDGSNSLQNGQKCYIMRVLRTNYVMVFEIFHLKWFANMGEVYDFLKYFPSSYQF